MIEVQSKPSRRSPHSGSVPVVMPQMLSSHASTTASLTHDIASLMLIVVVPTVFWCAVLSSVRSLLGWDTSFAALACVGLLIAGFLLVIRASLTIDRSIKPD
jgi:hypothetical protein